MISKTVKPLTWAEAGMVTGSFLRHVSDLSTARPPRLFGAIRRQEPYVKQVDITLYTPDLGGVEARLNTLMAKGLILRVLPFTVCHTVVYQSLTINIFLNMEPR